MAVAIGVGNDGAIPVTLIATGTVKATPMLAELEPRTATDALLAAQMVGAQRAAMEFLQRSLVDGQMVKGVDRNVNRATKLMRLFNEQIEAMAKLKGKRKQEHGAEDARRIGTESAGQLETWLPVARGA